MVSTTSTHESAQAPASIGWAVARMESNGGLAIVGIFGAKSTAFQMIARLHSAPGRKYAIIRYPLDSGGI